MKLFAPSYYKDFACIADRCQHSCCVGWEIDIDPDTLAHYETMTHPYGASVRNSISYQDDPHFALTAGDRCPHLNENGLCKLIIEAGESSLCEICREHPRFYHATAKGMEVGLGMSCEEACRLILSSDGYDAFCEVSHEDGDPEELFFDALPRRDTLYRILSHETLSHSAKLEEIETDLNELIRTDGDGSKTKLNSVLANYGVNYKMLKEYYVMKAKFSAVQDHIYSTMGPNVKGDYLKENYDGKTIGIVAHRAPP